MRYHVQRSANNRALESENLSEPCAASEAVPSRRRSAVTNGTRLFVDGDGNSAWSRRFRDLVASHVSDLGGIDRLSESQRSLVRRVSAIEVELEQMEGRLSMGEEIDLDMYTRSASHLRRILESLGLQREPRDVTPPLQDYIKGREAAAA